MNLHLGCGNQRFKGWINLDRMAGGDIQSDVLDGLPFADSSIDAVFSADFLEHLPADRRVFIMNEIWRVLKHDGTMEHYVPNAGSRNAYGSPTHLSFWNYQCFEHFDMNSHRWVKDHEMEGFTGAFTHVLSELVNWQKEDDGINRAQSVHVKYRAVKC